MLRKEEETLAVIMFSYEPRFITVFRPALIVKRVGRSGGEANCHYDVSVSPLG